MIHSRVTVSSRRKAFFCSSQLTQAFGLFRCGSLADTVAASNKPRERERERADWFHFAQPL